MEQNRHSESGGAQGGGVSEVPKAELPSLFADREILPREKLKGSPAPPDLICRCCPHHDRVRDGLIDTVLYV